MIHTKSHFQQLKIMNLVCYSMVLLALGIFGCGDDDDDDNDNLSASKLDPNWQIVSSAFLSGQEIPERFSCDGEDISPALSWAEPPAGTKSLALFMDDPDAGGFAHWILYNLPAAFRELNENIPRETSVATLCAACGDASQGENDFPTIGYGGPCPPRGSTHTYRFRLFALDTPPNLPPQLDSSAFLAEIDDHVIAETQLMGVFSR